MGGNSRYCNQEIVGLSLNEHRRDHPLKVKGESNIIDHSTDCSSPFVSFFHTSLESDSAQTAIPFFDAQSVAPAPAVPLSGFGLSFKSSLRSGGFVTPIVKTTDYTTDLIEWDFESFQLLYLEYANRWLIHNYPDTFNITFF